jgi:cytochrome c-type biogenesis protein CcmH
MTLWFLLALMTAAAVFAVLWPLGRASTPLAADQDLAVYRDQLEEIERDLADGAIAPSDAEAARVEISRRLIAAADRAVSAPRTAAARLNLRRITAVVALVAMPLGAAVLYGALGSPGLPDQPLAARVAPDDGQTIAAMLARIETHLEQNPGDGRGWEVVAPVYLRLERYDDAVKARRNALRILGETAERQADLGEAIAAAANGIVTADAKAAFERARALDPKDVKAQFYLGLAAEQDGKPDDAAHIWHDLLAQAPADAPWLGFVRQSLARVDKSVAALGFGAAQDDARDIARDLEQSAPAGSGPGKPPGGVAGAAQGNGPQSGPSSADIAAAAEMTPEQRLAMVRGMVDRLAARLHQDGSDVDGWLRLVRAYMVLGDVDKAKAAAADARRALAGEPEKLRRLDDGVKGFGLEG